MHLDHIGVVVRSIEEGVKLWIDVFGYTQATSVTTNTRQNVRVVFMKKTGSMDIKLVEPASESSPVAALARRGGGLHHLCFKCENITEGVTNLAGLGARVLNHPEPGEAFENEKIAFLYMGQGLNIELIDTEKRAHRL